MYSIREDFLLISGELAGLSFTENLKRSLNLEQCLQDMNLRYTAGVGMWHIWGEESERKSLADE